MLYLFKAKHMKQSSKKAFLTFGIALSVLMIILFIATSIYIGAMREYTSYLNEYFYDVRQSGYIIVNEPAAINIPVGHGRDYVFNSALVFMTIMGSLITIALVVAYVISLRLYKEEEKKSLTKQFIFFLNISLSFICAALFSYLGGIYVSIVEGYLGEAIESLLRWTSCFVGLRFIFILSQMVLERKNLTKASLIVSIFYCAASFSVFILLLILAIQYHPFLDAFYLIILGAIAAPIIFFGFEGGLLALKVERKKKQTQE